MTADIERPVEFNPPRQTTRILAIANQKGGVGKTTTAINLATALAAIDKEVLLVDLDPQGNATTGVGLDPREQTASIYDVIIGQAHLLDAVRPTVVPKLSLVPSSVDLSGAELELAPLPRREAHLRRALDGQAGTWDYVLIDCPPALGLLTLNALVAADAVLVPLQAEYYALEGLSHLLRTLKGVKRALNPRLDLHGVVITMFDRRNNLCQMVAQDVRSHLGDRVYETIIPRNVKVSEAPSHGKPVLIYDLRCPGSKAYLRLAKELLVREAAGLTALAS